MSRIHKFCPGETADFGLKDTLFCGCASADDSNADVDPGGNVCDVFRSVSACEASQANAQLENDSSAIRDKP